MLVRAEPNETDELGRAGASIGTLSDLCQNDVPRALQGDGSKLYAVEREHHAGNGRKAVGNVEARPFGQRSTRCLVR